MHAVRVQAKKPCNKEGSTNYGAPFFLDFPPKKFDLPISEGNLIGYQRFY